MQGHGGSWGRGHFAHGGRFYADGLLPECEDQDVRLYFSQFGKVTEAYVAREKDTLLSRCFASVVMHDQQVIKKIMGSLHQIWGSTVVATERSPSDEERPEMHAPLPAPPGQALEMPGRFFVNCLAEDLTEKDLTQYFGQFGEVSECLASVDDGGNRSASIKMPDHAGVVAVLKELTHEVKGQQLKVSKRLERAKPKRKAPEIRAAAGEVEVGKFFVGSLAEGTTEEDLRKHFASVGEVGDVNVVKDRVTGSYKNCAFVAFAKPTDDLKKAMLAESHTINEHVVRIEEARVRKGKGESGKDNGKGSGNVLGGFEWSSYSGCNGIAWGGKAFSKGWGWGDAWCEGPQCGSMLGAKGDGKSWGASHWSKEERSGKAWAEALGGMGGWDSSYDQGFNTWSNCATAGKAKGWGSKSGLSVWGGKGKSAPDDRGKCGAHGDPDAWRHEEFPPRKRQMTHGNEIAWGDSGSACFGEPYQADDGYSTKSGKGIKGKAATGSARSFGDICEDGLGWQSSSYGFRNGIDATSYTEEAVGYHSVSGGKGCSNAGAHRDDSGDMSGWLQHSTHRDAYGTQ